MARGAWIGYAGLLSLLWRDEAEGVRRDVVVFDGLLDSGHVAGNALAARTVGRVMSVLTDSAVQTGRIQASMAAETERISTYGESGDGAAVHLMAIEATDLTVIHVALHEIVALHAVFVRCEIGELIEVGCAGLGVLELPVVGQSVACGEAHRPVIVAAIEGIGEGAALAVALNAGVVCADEVEFVGVDDVGPGGMGNMNATGAVALLAAYIPLGDSFCLDVVVDGVTAVAGGSGGAVEVCGTVVRHPPIGAGLNVIREPPVLLNIPLRG